MKVISGLKEMQTEAMELRGQGKTIGLVPTMGFLHKAHLSLMELARPHCDVLVVSIFVNPMQFGPAEDFDKYPRDMERDMELCRHAGVDILFCPSVDAMYPDAGQTIVEDLVLSDVIEGKKRPSHFRGVSTVVAKLFNIVLPDVATFGEKDAQQLRIIRNMVASLNFPIRILAGPIVREPDGLAMSSRNKYLAPGQRADAVCLYESLQRAKALFESGMREVTPLLDAITDRIDEAKTGELDYVEIVDESTFQPVDIIVSPARILMVVRFGKTRLLDNLLLSS